MKLHDENPVILNKLQGKVQLDTCKYLTERLLQSPLQADLMKKLGNDKVNCVDSTHVTNEYDFNLITVMVIDEYCEGYPASWCTSNREDQLLLIINFVSFKERVGNLSPKWIVTPS